MFVGAEVYLSQVDFTAFVENLKGTGIMSWSNTSRLSNKYQL